MNNKKILNAIGLCKRAGKLITGESMVVESIRSKNAKLVLISSDCEKNTFNKVVNKCKFYNVEYFQLELNKYEIGQAIGKDIRVCVAIQDAGFKKMILKEIRSD